MRTQRFPKAPPPMSETQARRHVRQWARALLGASEPPDNIANDAAGRRVWRSEIERIVERI
jgi:hypothetical protein